MNLEKLVDRVRGLCFMKGIRVSQCLSECGLDKNVLNNMKTSVPSIDKIMIIAEYFEVSMDYLLHLDDVPNRKTISSELSEDEKNILKLYRNLSVPNKNKATGYMEAMQEDVKNTKVI